LDLAKKRTAQGARDSEMTRSGDEYEDDDVDDPYFEMKRTIMSFSDDDIAELPEVSFIGTSF